MYASEKKVRYCGQFRGGLFCTKHANHAPPCIDQNGGKWKARKRPELAPSTPATKQLELFK